MRSLKDALRLYVITDRSLAVKNTVYEQVELAIRGGATMVQLREKGMDREMLIAEAVKLKKLCHSFGVPLIINDDWEAALKSGADGVHVGAEDTPVSAIRAHAPEGFIIGATAKTGEQAMAAKRDGADYIGVGALFPSPTKKNAVGITPAMLKKICSCADIPAVAIGGLNLYNIDVISGSGVCGAAVVSAVFAARDITYAAACLNEKIQEVIGNDKRCDI